MSFGERLVYDTQELLSQLSFHSRVEGWVVPGDVSFSCPVGLFSVAFRVESQFIRIAALIVMAKRDAFMYTYIYIY